MPLFPEITPFATQMLPVTEGHTLYIEQSGNPKGLPVVVLHGGPGSGCNPKHRQRFNPEVFHIICFDQRGAGQSTPSGGLSGNTTQHLVEDIEAIRTHLGIGHWMVYGTSWGSTLALAYAQSYPEVVTGMVLGGIFLGTLHELKWMIHPTGAARFASQAYYRLVHLLGNPPAPELLQTLYQAVVGENAAFAREAAAAWMRFEGMLMDLNPNAAELEEYIATAPDLVAHAALELHYFVNGCFLSSGQLMANTNRIAHIPLHILQGGVDLVCPPETADMLHAVLPHSTYTLVPACGHRATEEMEEARLSAIAQMAARLVS